MQTENAIQQAEAIVASEQWERPALASGLFWGSLPFPKSELNEKTLEFRVTIKFPEYDEPVICSGVGTMYVRERPGGFHIRVLAPYSQDREKVIDLTAKHASLITRHEDASRAVFSLVAPE